MAGNNPLTIHAHMTNIHPLLRPDQADLIWSQLRHEASEARDFEPVLTGYILSSVLNRKNFSDALGHVLARELVGEEFDALQLNEIFAESHKSDPSIVVSAQHDLIAVVQRDPAAANKLLTPFLFFKGFHALQSYRVAHWLWQKERTTLAFYFQSRIAKRFSVDIHPAARIGHGIMMDHANGIVIGETTVVENDVSFLHSVTLGGTGKEGGDRHPKIRTGVMIGAGAKILGNIEIGAGARIAAGSVVLEAVPPCVTVAGVPAKIVGKSGCNNPAEQMDQMIWPDSSAT